MGKAERYHRLLRQIAIAFAAVNLVTIFTCDLREWFVYFDPIPMKVGVLPVFVVALPLLPFVINIDGKVPAPLSTIVWLIGTSATMIVFEAIWFAQIIIATFCRGPFWSFYWPWEQRVPKLVPLNLLDLSELFWLVLLGYARRPEGALREAPGLCLLAIHFFLSPFLAFVVWRRCPSQTSSARLWTFLLLVQALSFTLLKMTMHQLFNIRYIVSFSQAMLNI